jgi:hypothetical protein
MKLKQCVMCGDCKNLKKIGWLEVCGDCITYTYESVRAPLTPDDGPDALMLHFNEAHTCPICGVFDGEHEQGAPCARLDRALNERRDTT